MGDNARIATSALKLWGRLRYILGVKFYWCPGILTF
jgi:hypothetical protein